MSKKDFKVGDRVEAPDKKQGTVQYVGGVHWTKGTWVGVAFDDPVGKSDGMSHKKRYFKCKANHGVMQKSSYWKKVTGGKKGGKDKKGGKEKKGKGKKGGGGGGGGADKAPKEIERTPEPPKPAVVTVDNQTQTDPPEETVSNQYLCKLISRMYQDRLESVEKQRDEAQKQVADALKESESNKNELMQLQYDNKMKAQEIEKFKDALETLELECEDLRVQNEMLNIDIEECNEKLEDNFVTFKATLNVDDQAKAEILRTNEQLKQQLESVFKSGMDAINSKDKTIYDLTMDNGYMNTLSERVKQLLSVEREVVQLRSDVKELKDQLETLQDAERMVKQLTESNNELEGELQDWREYVMDVDNERAILEELHAEDDAIIKELQNGGQKIASEFSQLSKKYGQKDVEISDLQKELFKLRMEVQKINSAQESGLEFAEMTSAVDTSGTVGGDAGSVTTGAGPLSPRGAAASGKKLQIIINENVSLKSQLDQVRNILIRQIDGIVSGKADYLHRNLLSLYFPTTLKIDVQGIDALKMLQRFLCKAGFTRDLLERFYADPSSSALKNPNLARQAHWLCPLILEQENYTRALQKGLLMCKEENWKSIVTTFSKIAGIEKPINTLLEHINNSTLEEYNDGDLTNNKKILSALLKQNFPTLDIEIEQKDDDRVEKPKVLLMMSETHYRFQNLSLRLNEFNSKMHKIVHAPAETTRTITEQIMGSPEIGSVTTAGTGDETATDALTDDTKDDESKADEPPKAMLIAETVNEAINSLRIGVIEKMFKLRNTLLDHLKEIISKSQPIDLGFRTKYINATILIGANRTQVKYAQLKVCKSDARKAVARIEEMLKKLSQVTTAMSPKERVNKINRIFEDEEEHNSEGLLNVLDSAYSNVRSVKTITDSTINSTLRNTDELTDMTSEEKDQMKTDKLFPVWELRAADIRDKIDEAGQIREDMEKMKVDMKQQRDQVFETHKVLDEQRSIISTIQKQREVESAKVTDLAESQKRTQFLQVENDKLTKSNNGLEKQNKEYEDEIREKNELIKKYKKSMEKFKDKQMLGSKPSARVLPSLDTSFTGRSRTGSRADRSEIRQLRSLSPHPKSPQTGQRRSIAFGLAAGAGGALGLTNNTSNGPHGIHGAIAGAAGGASPAGGGGAIGRALLGFGAANALTYYDEEDINYSDLLQDTIQTLRRKVSQLTMKNKLINVELGLKPLPIVSIKNILNDENGGKDSGEKKEEKKDKKKRTRIVKKTVKKRVKKKKPATDESKDNEDDTTVTTEKTDGDDADATAGGDDDDYVEIDVEIDVEEEVTDDEDETDKIQEAENALLKKHSDLIRKEITSITGSLNSVRATPQIVDIAKKTYGGQDVIGRQFKLRDIRLKYLTLKEDIKKSEEANGLNDDTADENNLNKQLGSVLGKVSIPDSIPSSLIPQSQNVLIAPQKLDEFQKTFL